MNPWVALYRFALGLLIVLAIVGAVSIFLPPSRDIRQYQKKRLQLETDNQHIEDQIRDLVEKQTRFKSDPTFIERTAREAGMVKSNEVMYKLEASDGAR